MLWFSTAAMRHYGTKVSVMLPGREIYEKFPENLFLQK